MVLRKEEWAPPYVVAYSPFFVMGMAVFVKIFCAGFQENGMGGAGAFGRNTRDETVVAERSMFHWRRQCRVASVLWVRCGGEEGVCERLEAGSPSPLPSPSAQGEGESSAVLLRGFVGDRGNDHFGDRGETGG